MTPCKLWDPFAGSLALGRMAWLFLFLFILIFQGPALIESLRPPPLLGTDFFQDWVSGRNLLEGRDVYEELKPAIVRHFDLRPEDVQPNLPVNGHPPTSILLIAPFCVLDYSNAMLAWNLVSLACIAFGVYLIVRGLELPWTAWSLLPCLTLMILFSPLREQITLGQYNGVLFLLLTACWACGRSGRDIWAGVFLGVATAIKLYPGFVFFYFLIRGRHRLLIAGVLAFLTMTALTGFVLGFDIFPRYVRDVMPAMNNCRSSWLNASLIGLAAKLFDPYTVEERVLPLWRSPWLAALMKVVLCGSVFGVFAWRVRNLGSRLQEDLGYALTLTAMLLVAPMAWHHYFVVLLLPILLLWYFPPVSTKARLVLFVTLILLWVNPTLVHNATIPDGQKGMATPLHTLTVLSFQCYALVALFALLVLRIGESPGGQHP